MREPFVYFLGFGGAALTMLAAHLSRWGLQTLSGGGQAAALSNACLLAAPMMMFAEGFLTGALVTGAVVYAPERLETWDDKALPGAGRAGVRRCELASPGRPLPPVTIGRLDLGA